MNAVAGIDVGSLGLRVAWSGPDGAPVDLAVPSDEPWVVARLGPGVVDFVPVKQQRSPEAVRQLVTALVSVRERVIAESGVDCSRAVLTVPARMDSRDRGALRDAARAAGFSEVHLINDSVAAVLASEGSGARTVLVYSMGHSGFEVGLLRAARSQVRVLGHIGADTPSGDHFDCLVLTTWLHALPESELPAIQLWGADEWMRHRYLAAQVKEQLAAGTEVSGWPSPAEFAGVVDDLVGKTAARVREVLAEADLLVRDIDTVLLVGGSTALSAVPAVLLAEVGQSGVPTSSFHLARGAAVYGAQLGDAPAAVPQDSEFIDTEPSASAAVALPVPRTDPLSVARSLWSADKASEARCVLTDLIDEAVRLRAEIDAAPAVTSNSAHRTLERAGRLLESGRLGKAVQDSHLAWEMAADDNDVFRQMIDVHLRAARAAAGPQGYPAAREWLKCAESHARFNEEVVTELFERTLAQARFLHARGQRADAAELLEECRKFKPDDPGVVALDAEMAV